MTQEEAADLLEIFRRDNSEVPPVNTRKLVAVYLALLEGRPPKSGVLGRQPK